MGTLISDKFTAWEAECNQRFNQLKANEEELNRIFIDIYGLQDELTPEAGDQKPAFLCGWLYVWPLLSGCGRPCLCWR